MFINGKIYNSQWKPGVVKLFGNNNFFTTDEVHEHMKLYASVLHGILFLIFMVYFRNFFCLVKENGNPFFEVIFVNGL